MARSRNRRRPMVEGLEQRALMALLSTDIPLLSPYSVAGAIVSGPGGKLWFTESEAVYLSGKAQLVYALGSIDPTTSAITEYPSATVDPAGRTGAITVGPGGTFWFTEPYVKMFGMFDPTTHQFSEFPFPSDAPVVEGIAASSDGNIYFTEWDADQIGEINSTTHGITEFPLPKANGYPGGITAGPDGDLWFGGAGFIGQVNPTTHAITEFPGLIGSPTISPSMITVGPGGDLWFNEYSIIGLSTVSYNLAELDPTTHIITAYPGGPASELTAGPDGDLYYVGGGSQFINELNLTSQVITTYPIPPVPPPSVSFPIGIALGSDGNLWYTRDTLGRVGVASLIPTSQAAISGTLSVGSATSPAGRTVYVDLKGDGVFDPGDPSAITNFEGGYTITGLVPGTYSLRVSTYSGELVKTPAGGGLTVTVTGGQLARGEDLTILSTSSVLPLTYNTTPFGLHNPDVQTAEVTGLYNIVLGRAPDAAGLAIWVNALKSGTIKLPQVIAGVLDSTEYLSNVVASYYQDFLGRAGSPGEIAAWVSAIEGGMSEEEVATRVLASTEYSVRHAGDADFIQSLYNNVLGRQAANTEVAAWAQAVNAGTSRLTVAQGIVYSSEAASRAVYGFYPVIVQALVDPTGAEFWINALLAGATQSGVAAQFFSTAGWVALANETVG